MAGAGAELLTLPRTAARGRAAAGLAAAAAATRVRMASLLRTLCVRRACCARNEPAKLATKTFASVYVCLHG
eukprot:21585-Lingulodinium_polyedra.AAC.1